MFKRSRNSARLSQPPNTAIDTLVGRSTRIEGDMVFSGGFHLDGQVTGNVRAAEEGFSVLTVSEHGCIEGSVEVAHVILNGVVKGDIAARERVELGPKARVSGNVYYGVIEMAMGAEITGKLIHTPPAAPSTAEASPK